MHIPLFEWCLSNCRATTPARAQSRVCSGHAFSSLHPQVAHPRYGTLQCRRSSASGWQQRLECASGVHSVHPVDWRRRSRSLADSVSGGLAGYLRLVPRHYMLASPELSTVLQGTRNGTSTSQPLGRVYFLLCSLQSNPRQGASTLPSYKTNKLPGAEPYLSTAQQCPLRCFFLAALAMSCE